MNCIIKCKFIGMSVRPYNEKNYYDMSVLQDGNMDTDRISISEGMYNALSGIEELTPLTVTASAWAHCKNDRAWINWRASDVVIGWSV